MVLGFLFTNGNAWGQNSLNSGDFNGGTWGIGRSMSASAGGTLIITVNSTTEGDKYFRFFGDGSPCGEYQPNTNGEFFSANDVVTTPNANCGNSNAWRINLPTSSSNIVFKTDGQNDGIDQAVAFVIQGTIQTISSVSQNPTSLNVFPGQAVTVTAAMSGIQTTGQNVYLRYSTDNFASSTVVTMTYSGTSATTTIPASVNKPSTTVRYYVFTSGTANVATNGSNADLYTINFNN
jgi:hypothetical protein